MVYQVLDEFPVLNLNTHVFLDENFIEFSFKNRRTDSYLRNLFRNRDLDLQVIYDIACKYFAISFDLQILNTFLQNLFRQNEYNSPNYVKTELNAIILALTYPEVFSEEQTDSLTEFESHLENMHTFNDPSVIFKKSLALILTYVRLGNVERTRRLLDSLQILHFRKSAYECILWTMVSVEKFDLFFEFLDRLILEDSRFEAFDMTALKVGIAKSRSEPFIEELMRKYDVSKMFSGNLGGEAVYSKRLHLRLLRFADETSLLSHSILNENLFLYAVYHFKDNIEDWERFFELNQVMSYSSFASLIAYLLVNHRSLPVFELILRLFIDNRIRFATWGRPNIVFNLDAAKFIFENPTLHELIGFLRERFRLCCESDVMSYLIIFHGDANKALLFKAFKFEMKDFLIQLNTWRQLKLAQKIFNWTEGYL
ncbi:MAG: hypothetical protein EBU93_07000, partial [Chlamydiae bacterium]|nr:hypothetical protein [Chlamydiota bacterium]